ncbi:hypothetical protein WP12_18895, partial [Sphingomonas sp. SRS2]
PEVEPHHMADDLPRVAETAVKLRTCHLIILSRRGRLWQLDNAGTDSVTVWVAAQTGATTAARAREANSFFMVNSDQ